MKYFMSGDGDTVKPMVKELLAFPEYVNNFIDTQYSMERPYIPKRRKATRQTTLVECCVCGKSQVTLYKIGENRYCKECKKGIEK